MKSSYRLTSMFIALMLLPMLIAGVFTFAVAWAYISPEAVSAVFSHWMMLLLFTLLILGTIIVACILSRHVFEQIYFLTETANLMRLGKSLHVIRMPHVYRELQPLAEHIKEHMLFHREIIDLMKAILRDSSHNPPLTLRSEDDEFVKAVNTLITRLHGIQETISEVTNGNLTCPQLKETSRDAYPPMQLMLSELRTLITKARHDTNQLVRTGSQIYSITQQGMRDSQIASKRINEISQSINAMAINVQSVAEHLQGQSFLLEDTSSSIDDTMRSVEEIVEKINRLKNVVEQNAPASLAFERSLFSLNRLQEVTRVIERDAATCGTLSQEAAQDAEEGKNVMRQSLEGIEHVQQSMSEFFERVRGLSERSEEVRETLEVISDVADQTNLLAINAAIISAHAGEHGRDFAVIADEIAKFAERTRESASEIDDLLRTIQLEFHEAMHAMDRSAKAIGHGVSLSAKAGKTLDTLLGSIGRTNETVGRIADSTAEQIRENDHVRQIINELELLQTQKREEVNDLVWQLMQAIAQIRGITTEQAEGNAQIAAVAKNLEQITQEIGRATNQHVSSAQQIVEAVEYLRRVMHRTTLGTEKNSQLTGELFSVGSNLAFTIGEFTLAAPPVPTHPELQRIGFVSRGDDLFFDAMLRGIEKEAGKHGFDTLAVNSHYEATTQVEQVNTLFKQQGVKGIILCPVDVAVAQKLVQRGLSVGIPTVAADETVPSTITVRSGNQEGGAQAAELLMEKLEANALVGVVVDPTVESMRLRLSGFRRKAEQYPFDLIEIYCDMTLREDAPAYILTALEENPGLQGLFLTNEGVTSEYLNAVHTGMFSASHVLAIGYDQTPLAEEAIRNGELLGAVFQHPEKIGEQAFHYLRQLIMKEIRLEEVEEKTIYIPTRQMKKESLNQ